MHTEQRELASHAVRLFPRSHGTLTKRKKKNILMMTATRGVMHSVKCKIPDSRSPDEQEP
jgi:hypothetical protein